MTPQQVEDAIEMGRERGFLRYARTIPGLKFQPPPPAPSMRIEADEEVDTAADPEINYKAFASEVDRRAAARNAAALGASGRIVPLNFDDVKVAAKAYVLKIVRERQALAEQ
jgi:hypothetical protein